MIVEIVERRRADDSSLSGEARFRAIFARASVGIAIIDRNGHAIESNPALQHMFGYSSKELRGRALHEFAHPEDIEPDATLFREMLTGRRKHYQIEKRYFRKSGEVMWGRLNVSLLREIEDGPAFSVAILEDINERKQFEETLIEARQFADNLIQTANVMIIGLDTEGNVTLFNPTAERLTGYTRAEIEGKNWFELLVPRDTYPRVHQEFSQLLTGGLPKSFRNPIRTKSGEERFIAWSNNELVRDGTIIGTVSFGIDITDERQAQRRLRESKALIKAVFSSLYGHVAVLDRDGRILAVNDAWMRFAQENQGRLSAVGVGANYFEACLRAIAAGDPNAVKALAGIESVRNGECEEFVVEYPCASSTEERWFEMVVHPLRRPEGGLVISHIDISGRRRAEIDAHTMRQELWHVARVATMGELTASLAHELNQPLAAILSNAQTVQRLLDNNPPDMTEIREILGDIVSDDQRASDIIRGLRSMLKKGELNLRPLDINSVIRDVIELVRSDALIKNVMIALRLAPDILKVRGDRVQLQQLVLNLVINAFDAMRDVPVNERRLEISTTPVDTGSVQVAVQDSGTGILPERLEKVFEPFFTGKSQGMGMGLTICRSIVHMHGGRIWAANNTGRGVTFRFILPIDEGSVS